MPKRKLAQSELEICERLRRAREVVVEITQLGCARQIGLERSTLANYETGRTPLRWDVALRFCRQFIICEEWLATGRFDACHISAEAHGISGKNGWEILDQEILIRQCVDLLSDSATIHLRPGMLFSEAYSAVLAPRFSKLVNQFFSAPTLVLSDNDDPKLAENWLATIHARHILLLGIEAARLKLLPSDYWRLYTRYLFECSTLIYRKLIGRRLDNASLAGFDWLRAVLSDPDAAIGPPLVQVFESRDGLEVFQKKELTETASHAKLSEVKPPFSKLLEDIRKATSAPGQMSVLADYLGKKTGKNVPLASVSRWLSGKREPGGEVTLWMQKWASDPQRQK